MKQQTADYTESGVGMMDNTMNAYMDAQNTEMSGVGKTTPDGFDGVYEAQMDAQTVSKPYEFRRLKSRDVFPMVKLIRKIGVSKAEISKLLDYDLISSIRGNVQTPTEDQMDEINDDLGAPGKDENATKVGITLILNIADLVMERLPECEDDLYDFLSRVSNLSAEEIKDLDINVFVEMIVDFFKKDEFRDFFKAVSALMK